MKMETVDELMGLMTKFTRNTRIKTDEIGEQEDAGSTGGQPYPTVTKWETGLTRGVANSVDSKSTWKSLNTITRGKANTLL
jgi:hypothetical protein